MTCILKTWACTAVALTICASAGAAENASAQDAVAMVKKVVASVKANGKEKTIAEINSPDSKYVDRDLYVTVWTLEGVNLAHNRIPKVVGKDLSQIRDADGKYFIRERNEALKTKSSAWVDFKWPNPDTNRLENRSVYSERLDDLVIDAGILKQ